MKLSNESAELAMRVLNKCSDQVEPAGPWRWSCAVQNGRRLPIAAEFDDGFLHLVHCPANALREPCALEDSLRGNSALAGGVKLALGESASSLHMQTDIVVLDEKQLLDRFWWAIDGFHDGCGFIESPASHLNRALPEPSASRTSLGELLHQASWPSKERGPNEYSADLDVDSAPPVIIRSGKTGVVLSVELIRSNGMTESSRRALTIFLLTAGSTLRLVRACAAEAEVGWRFGIEVSLPPAPAPEEIDHALAALSSAYRQCARESTVLLDDAAARCYLAARDTSTTYDQQPKEN